MLLSSDLIDRIKLPFRKEKELFSSLRDIMGFYPRRIEYYKLALMHKSVSRRNAKGRPLNNERLEFLGDAVLDAVVGDIVYRHFEGKREGFLTNTRSKLVQRETLNRLAQEMGINQLIHASTHSNSHNSYMGGNAFEALVGAIYLDRGYGSCMRFMQERILSQLINIDKVAYKEVNFKSKLIEWSQKNRVSLEFALASQTKDDNGSPVFVYKAVIEGKEAGKGKGYSKKESQQLASKEALQKLRREPQFIDAVFAAKAARTKMEEQPVATVPETEEKADFIVAKPEPRPEGGNARGERRRKPAAAPVESAAPAPEAAAGEEKDEFDLSDITATPKEMSREDIIAMAEAAAFAGAEGNQGQEV